MNKLLMLVASLLLTTSCVKLTGNLEVHDQLTLKSKRGNHEIAPGNYEAKLSWKSKKKFKLTLTEGKNKKFTFNVPEGMKLPQNRGEVTLLSNQTGQPVDIKAQINTKRRRSATRSERDTCSVTRTITRCYTDGDGQRVCRDETVTYNGYRYVRYHYLYTYTGMVMELSEPNSAEIKATFDGRNTSSQRIVEYEGPCSI